MTPSGQEVDRSSKPDPGGRGRWLTPSSLGRAIGFFVVVPPCLLALAFFALAFGGGWVTDRLGLADTRLGRAIVAILCAPLGLLLLAYVTLASWRVTKPVFKWLGIVYYFPDGRPDFSPL